MVRENAFVEFFFPGNVSVFFFLKSTSPTFYPQNKSWLPLTSAGHNEIGLFSPISTAFALDISI